MRRVLIFVGIIVIIFTVVVLFIRRDITKLNSKVNINKKVVDSTPSSADLPPYELLISTTVAGEKRLLLQATVDHITTENKYGVISMLLLGKSSPVVTLDAQLGTADYKHLVRFRTPLVINQKQVNSKAFPVKELLSFLTKDKVIQLELGFAPGTDEMEVFQRNFNIYIESVKEGTSSNQPFVILYPFIKGIELF